MTNNSEEIISLLRNIRRSINRHIEEHACGLGITIPQAMLLRILAKEGCMTVTEISKRLGVAKSTVSGITDRLEKQGFVRREEDVADRRSSKIYLTGKMQEMIAGLPLFQGEYFNSLLTGLSDQEIKDIIRSLRILDERLSK